MDRDSLVCAIYRARRVGSSPSDQLDVEMVTFRSVEHFCQPNRYAWGADCDVAGYPDGAGLCGVVFSGCHDDLPSFTHQYFGLGSRHGCVALSGYHYAAFNAAYCGGNR